MTRRKEILKFIDDFLENKITKKEAIRWARQKLSEFEFDDDPTGIIVTVAFELEPGYTKEVKTDITKELHDARATLIRGIPCPRKEVGKTIEAYWMGFTPNEKVVLGQIKKIEKGGRVLEVIEEGWSGEQAFYEQIPIPIEKEGPPLTKDELKDKIKAYEEGTITREDTLIWVVDKLQTMEASQCYERLIELYWNLRKRDAYFIPYYIKLSG